MKQQYIGENIRIYRERAKLTQQQLADKVGVSWEMISRYEREKSSPLNQLDEISNALQVSKTELLEKHIPQRYASMVYKVPHFMSIPHPNKFLPSQTNYYYSCPEWILKKDMHVFALETSLVTCEISNLHFNGILYISTNLKPKNNDLIVTRKENELLLQKYNHIQSNILGKVLAHEYRY